MMYRMQHRAAPLGSPVIAMRRTLVGLGASKPPQILDGECKLHCFQGPVQTAPTATLQQGATLTATAPVASSSTSTGAPVEDQCTTYLYQWAVANPQRAACMTAADMNAALAVCIAMFSGQISNEQGLQEFDMIVAGACKRKGGGDGKRTRAQCTDEIDAFISMLPVEQRGCIEDIDRLKLIELCDLTYNYGLMPATAAAKASQIIAEACERAGDRVPVAEPPAVAPPPPGAAPPPPAPPVEREAQEEIYGSVPPNSGYVAPNGTPANGGGERAAPPVTQTQDGAIRRWGPVVGVLLLLGGAVYVIRKQAAA